MLQSLTVDESCWLENFFISNMTPLFYVESLADLSKEFKDDRTPRKFVSQLAERTPTMDCYPNIHHNTLILNELFGKKIPMDGRPLIAGGKLKITQEGQTLVDHDLFPEDKALIRWQEEKFTVLEKEFAFHWREDLLNLNLENKISLVKNILPKGIKLNNLEKIKTFINNFIEQEDMMILELLCSLIDVIDPYREQIREKWMEHKPRNLIEMAPYTAFILSIDLFYYLSIHLGQISGVRKSNRIDIAYLYYLPFCNVFSSSDKLHKRVAPLFMNSEQVFIDGITFKKALKWLDDYYSKLSEKVKKEGLVKFATYPPEEKNLVSDLWDKYLILWRKHLQEKKLTKPKTKKEEKEIVDKMNWIKKQSLTLGQPLEFDAVDSVMFTKKVRLKKGKWNLFPPEVEEKMIQGKNSF